jgi:hypothetical protein
MERSAPHRSTRDSTVLTPRVLVEAKIKAENSNERNAF